jgi:hypothetical protein
VSLKDEKMFDCSNNFPFLFREENHQDICLFSSFKNGCRNTLRGDIHTRGWPKAEKTQAQFQYFYYFIGKRDRIRLRNLLNECDSVIGCISNVGASFYAQREQIK